MNHRSPTSTGALQSAGPSGRKERAGDGGFGFALAINRIFRAAISVSENSKVRIYKLLIP
jgi:hypothetical protein